VFRAQSGAVTLVMNFERLARGNASAVSAFVNALGINDLILLIFN